MSKTLSGFRMGHYQRSHWTRWGNRGFDKRAPKSTWLDSAERLPSYAECQREWFGMKPASVIRALRTASIGEVKRTIAGRRNGFDHAGNGSIFRPVPDCYPPPLPALGEGTGRSSVLNAWGQLTAGRTALDPRTGEITFYRDKAGPATSNLGPRLEQMQPKD